MTAFDDRIAIATPEGVELELVLAGMGSRFIGAAIDSAIQFGAIFALTVVLGPFTNNGYVTALLFVGWFLVFFAYDIVFETWNRGRTIGKLAVGLRVVRLGGEPVGFLTASVRNFLRIADFLPAFYTVGVISILTTKRNQRLGDLAAGTIVVRERQAAVVAPMPAFRAPPAPAGGPRLDWDLSAVTPDDVAIVRQFLDRRYTLQPGARAALAGDLATRLRLKVVGSADGWHPESFLEAIVAAKTTRA